MGVAPVLFLHDPRVEGILSHETFQYLQLLKGILFDRGFHVVRAMREYVHAIHQRVLVFPPAIDRRRRKLGREGEDPSGSQHATSFTEYVFQTGQEVQDAAADQVIELLRCVGSGG